jgi:hypothetical protein
MVPIAGFELRRRRQKVAPGVIPVFTSSTSYQSRGSDDSSTHCATAIVNRPYLLPLPRLKIRGQLVTRVDTRGYHLPPLPRLKRLGQPTSWR